MGLDLTWIHSIVKVNWLEAKGCLGQDESVEF